jgi:hypothetical protein
MEPADGGTYRRAYKPYKSESATVQRGFDSNGGIPRRI